MVAQAQASGKAGGAAGALVDPQRWRWLGGSVAVELELEGGAGSGNDEEGSGARQMV